MKRLAMIDDAFLRLESRRQPLHIGVLMLLEPPADAGDDFAAKLAAKWRQYTEMAPPFNQKLVLRKGLHYWEEDSHFDLDHHFVHLSLPQPGRVRELLAMVSRVHCGHLDRSYPLWRMYLIEGLEDGRIAVYVKMHHAMVDGIAGMKLLMKSMSTDREASQTMPPPWAISATRSRNAQPLPVPHIASGGITALRSLASSGIKSTFEVVAPVLKELRSTYADFRRGDPNLALGGFAPRCLFNEKISASRRFAAQSYSTPRIKAVAEHFGATSNDVLLAMCGSALRRYLQDQDGLPEKPLLAAVPVSVRRKGHESHASNEIAFTIAQLATDIDDPVARLQAIKSCMDYNKTRIQKLSPAQLTTYAAMMMLPGAVNSLFGLTTDNALGNVLISHVPGPRAPMYWQGAKLNGLYPVSVVLDGGAMNITIVSRQDFVDIGLIACRKTVPSVQRLLDYLEDALKELELALSASGKKAPAAKPRASKPKATKARVAAGKTKQAAAAVD